MYDGELAWSAPLRIQILHEHSANVLWTRFLSHFQPTGFSHYMHFHQRLGLSVRGYVYREVSQSVLPLLKIEQLDSTLNSTQKGIHSFKFRGGGSGQVIATPLNEANCLWDTRNLM